MEEADIVVVGGGSGGSAAAGRLSEGGKYIVALLEAGGPNRSIRTHCPGFMAFQTPATNYQFETVPQPGLGGRRGYQPRGKGMGGSSAINAMLYIRGNPWDYDNWQRLGASGWGWRDVLPYFIRSEHNERGGDAYHGANGPLWVSDQKWANQGGRDFIEAGRQLQIPENDDFNGARQEGLGLYQVTQKGGERWTAARAYLGDGKPPANVNIMTDVLAERVLFDDGRAWGVAYARGGQAHVIRARRAVVLAGGVFGTPQLLMLSGVGPGAHLAEHGIPVRLERDGVGKNLQDHIDYVASFETPGKDFMGRSLAGTVGVARAIGRWIKSRSGMMTTPYAEAGGFLTVMPDSPAPDVQFHFVIAPLEDHGRAPVKAHGYSCHVCVLRPESHGTVTLASNDPRAAPLIDPGFLTDDRDMAVLKAGVRAMYRILETPPMTRHQGRDRYPIDLADDAALERLIRARADTVYHPVGTARMGSDEEAVCDPHLRVRGIDGLYVADASVMPKLVSGNTNAPSIMIGERCADFVRADLG
ncbi:GMC family oxidoreductase [Hephaestia mangrovi]|uniref:GMC family oxidoreductase n=1 Tax=Hephaestia mangrovi TaxID=2873268 RepID=UPI001CA68338|nr:GMC family oxidoreductase N-terminal domain-containing protein [Hephaestia mangrovi]